LHSRRADIERVPVVLGLSRVCSAKPGLLGSLPSLIFDTGRATVDQTSDDIGFVFELTPQSCCLRLDRLTPPFQTDPALLKVVHPCPPIGLFLGLLGLTVTKVFLFDLGFLTTSYRILSFGGLGLALIGISWLYSRYGQLRA